MKTGWIAGPYGFHYLNLPYGYYIQIGWDHDALKVMFNNEQTMKARFQSLDEAKKAGEAFAKRILSEVLAHL